MKWPALDRLLVDDDVERVTTIQRLCSREMCSNPSPAYPNNVCVKDGLHWASLSRNWQTLLVCTVLT